MRLACYWWLSFGEAPKAARERNSWMNLAMCRMATYNTENWREEVNQSTTHWPSRVKHSGNFPARAIEYTRPGNITHTSSR